MSTLRMDRQQRRYRLAVKLRELAKDAWADSMWSRVVNCDVDPDSGSSKVSLEAALAWILLEERVPDHSTRFYIPPAMWLLLESGARRTTPKDEDGTAYPPGPRAPEDVLDDLINAIIKHAMTLGATRVASYLRREDKAHGPTEEYRGEGARVVQLGEAWGPLASIAELMDEAKVPPPTGYRGWAAHHIVLAFLNDDAFVGPLVDAWAAKAEERARFLRMTELSDQARKAVADFNASTANRVNASTAKKGARRVR